MDGLGAEIAVWWEGAIWWAGEQCRYRDCKASVVLWTTSHLQQQCLHGRHPAGAAGQAQEAGRQQGSGSAMAAGKLQSGDLGTGPVLLNHGGGGRV